MKVISKGKGKGWTRHLTCDDCGAVLEVTDSDCKLVSDQRDGDYWSCRCPECKGLITIAAKHGYQGPG